MGTKDLCKLAVENLLALRTKCGPWLKHIKLEIEERRQGQQDMVDQQEAEREAEAVRRGRLRAESNPQAPQYNASMPPEDGDWNVDPMVHPTPHVIPEPKTEDPKVQ